MSLCTSLSSSRRLSGGECFRAKEAFGQHLLRASAESPARLARVSGTPSSMARPARQAAADAAGAAGAFDGVADEEGAGAQARLELDLERGHARRRAAPRALFD